MCQWTYQLHIFPIQFCLFRLFFFFYRWPRNIKGSFYAKHVTHFRCLNFSYSFVLLRLLIRVISYICCLYSISGLVLFSCQCATYFPSFLLVMFNFSTFFFIRSVENLARKIPLLMAFVVYCSFIGIHKFIFESFGILLLLICFASNNFFLCEKIKMLGIPNQTRKPTTIERKYVQMYRHSKNDQNRRVC